MDLKEKKVKKSLIKAVSSVRKKFRALHHLKSGELRRHTEIFKPITGKLDALIDLQNKKEPQKPPIAIEDANTEHQTPAKKLRKKRVILYKNSPYGTRSRTIVRRTSAPTTQPKSKKAGETSGKVLASTDANLMRDIDADDDSSSEHNEANISGPVSLIIAKPKAKKGIDPQYVVLSSSDDDDSSEGVISPPAKRGIRGVKHRLIQGRMKRGNGIALPETMRYSKNQNVSYTYWNDPNELVDRLRLLVASKSAGHSGHVNEIMSIIEELREADIIV